MRCPHLFDVCDLQKGCNQAQGSRDISAFSTICTICTTSHADADGTSARQISSQQKTHLNSTLKQYTMQSSRKSPAAYSPIIACSLEPPMLSIKQSSGPTFWRDIICPLPDVKGITVAASCLHKIISQEVKVAQLVVADCQRVCNLRKQSGQAL